MERDDLPFGRSHTVEIPLEEIDPAEGRGKASKPPPSFPDLLGLGPGRSYPLGETSKTRVKIISSLFRGDSAILFVPPFRLTGTLHP